MDKDIILRKFMMEKFFIIHIQLEKGSRTILAYPYFETGFKNGFDIWSHDLISGPRNRWNLTEEVWNWEILNLNKFLKPV